MFLREENPVISNVASAHSHMASEVIRFPVSSLLFMTKCEVKTLYFDRKYLLLCVTLTLFQKKYTSHLQMF